MKINSEKRVNSSPTNGVIYIVSGIKHVNRALISAESVKQHMPDIPITLFTSDDVNSPFFDQIISIEPNENLGITKGPVHISPKVKYISKSPYDLTVFLDADTFISDSFIELFDLLNNFDIAIAHDTFRTFAQTNEFLSGFMKQLPDCYPIFNGGVIAFRKNENVDNVFQQWELLYNKYNQVIRSKGGLYFGDQTALREVLYMNKNVRVATLPPEYNCRTNHIVFVNLKAKIIHGVYPDLKKLEVEINNKIENRVFLPKLGTIHESSQKPFSFSKWYWKEKFRQFKKKKLIRKLIYLYKYISKSNN